MDESGYFHIKNTGKCPIFVNSKEIPSCKRINLSSDSLIEVPILPRSSIPSFFNESVTWWLVNAQFL
jgi:hypothetical protein